MNFRLKKPYKATISSIDMMGNIYKDKKRFWFLISAFIWAKLRFYLIPGNILVITKRNHGWIYKYYKS